MLSEIKTPADAKKVADLAEAARVYAKKIGLGLKHQNHAAEIKIRAQREGGKILRQMKLDGERAKQGQPQKETLQPVTLSELGIERIDAHRWQIIASIPADDFETFIAVGL